MLKLPSKEYLESVKLIAGLIQAAVIVIGILVSFLYCAAETITPSGLSLGDVFSIVIITLGFGIVVMLGSAYGMFAAVFPLQCLLWLAEHRNRQPIQRIEIIPSLQGKWTAFMSASLLAIFLLLIYAVHGKNLPDFSAARTFGFFPILGFFLLFILCTSWPSGRTPAPLHRAFLATVITVAVTIVVRPALLDFTMTVIGIRSAPSELIVVNKAEHARLEELAKQNSLDIRFCALPGSDSWATRDARAIWHNIGSKSYIRLLDRATNGQRNLRVPIAQDHLDVIGTESKASICRI
ncbi:hypothetical protein [Burkholderia ubonensis]|uniref:hypothetical protein n=1 Tax=Burkholderia ubonensis TaxID=101571 RepID=UPI0007548384|nr:hypothetical protein [Burkholderia ubonensis]KWO52351.1 hypothetical protein WM30_24710 [Burkholderia ubonensis]